MPVSRQEVLAALVRSFERLLNIELTPSGLDEEEERTTRCLAQEKYSIDAWIYKT